MLKPQQLKTCVLPEAINHFHLLINFYTRTVKPLQRTPNPDKMSQITNNGKPEPLETKNPIRSKPYNSGLNQ